MSVDSAYILGACLFCFLVGWFARKRFGQARNAKMKIIESNKGIHDILENAQEFFDILPNFVYIHQDYRMIYANPEMAHMIGVSDPKELIGQSIFSFYPEEYHQLVLNRMDSMRKGNSVETMEQKFRRWDGEMIYVESSGMCFDYRGKAAFIGMGKDITKRKRMEEELHFFAYHDELTGLANRRLFEQSLMQALQEAATYHRKVAVLVLDVDRFRRINDTLGHQAGDLFLQALANRILQIIGMEATVARIGGDEFSILIPGLNQVEEAIDMVEAIVIALLPPISIGNNELYLTPNIGIAFYPENSQDGTTLIKQAEQAMYAAKSEGSPYKLYTPKLKSLSSDILKLEHEIRKALVREEFEVFYQPQVDLHTERIQGVEALLRWNHPDKGMIAPAHFISLAEDTGLIIPLGEWVLRTACLQMKTWHEQGYPRITVAVNISIRQFHAPQFVANVEQILQETGLEPRYLELEITESMTHDEERTLPTILALEAMGIRISMDDFGTGYSSLSKLVNYPIHKLKIDQSFVRDIHSNRRNAAIGTSIISLAANLKIEVIAEGVENREQIEFLWAHGCLQGQGFYYSKPLRARDVELYMNNITKTKNSIL